jgi:hypothetical protein
MALIDKLKTTGTSLTKLKGTRPTTALRNAGDPLPVNNTFSKGEYSEYVLGTGGAIEQARAKDQTAFGK